MIRLINSNSKLQLVLDAPITTNQLDIAVFYSDKTSSQYNGGSQMSVSNNTTLVDICDPPTSTSDGTVPIRDIDTILITNIDTAVAMVLVYYDDSGVSTALTVDVLPVNGQLEYTHSNGWILKDCITGTAFISSVADTNTISLDVSGSNLTADVLYQNTATILISENVGGLKADFASMNVSQFTNDANYIDLTDLSAVSPLSYNNTTGVFTTSMATNKLIGRGTAGTGVMEQITIGSGLSLSGTTLSSTGLGGTVTTVSIVTANGISGSVDTATTTPAITLTLGNITPTTVNGNTITAGTGTLTLSTYTLTVGGNSSVNGTFSGTSSGINTGNQTDISGNAATATALQTARTIGGVSFDGTANITVATATAGFTVSGGNLALGANNITMTGTITGATGYNGLVITANTGVVTTGTWSATAISADKGGTGQTVYVVGDILSASTTTALSKIAAVAIGSYLRSAGTGTLPVWSTTTLPNSAVVGDFIYCSATNVYSNLAGVASGSYMRSGGVTTAPLWSTLILPNSATANRVVYGSATNTYGESANLAFDGTSLNIGASAVTGRSIDLTQGTATMNFGCRTTTTSNWAIYGNVTPNDTNFCFSGTAAGAITKMSASTSLGFQISGSNRATMTSTVWTMLTNTTLIAGTTSIAPLTFISGTNTTTAAAGNMEYNGTNFFATRTGTTREYIMIGDSIAAPSTSVGVGIVNFYGSAATNFLGDPVSWQSFVRGATTYKIPLYT